MEFRTYIDKILSKSVKYKGINLQNILESHGKTNIYIEENVRGVFSDISNIHVYLFQYSMILTHLGANLWLYTFFL